ncbi:nicotinate phosphoribosyltransferase [Desulfospira joergensenii]|uniref:nicotinate phosphoribosyltransferase n=1 Tax=Desulfospira joergensenii TaxID=53329 RepID=UPI0003B44E72|nr:nicotinate phosphoribosyltransferase [Desulfospira joergensenii]
MILSILDNDLYKFTMQQAVHTLYPRAEAEYKFFNRGNTRFPPGFARKLRSRVDEMAGLRLSADEKRYLADVCYFLTPVYLDFLESYTYHPGEVSVEQENGRFSLTVKGPWYRTILWEVPLMALISEIYFSMTDAPILPRPKIREINRKKARTLSRNQVRFADFGTRRRYSAANQENMIKDLLDVENNTLIGTSNVHFARKFKITPIGTLAHEWFMFHAVLAGYRRANIIAQDAWVRVFQGDLGIVLADTYTTDVFLSGFDTMHAKLFDGVRQDSGDPVGFLQKILDHYKKLRIDPCAKTIVFSDGLDVDRAVAIHRECKGKIKDAYGIGTNLTNDVGVVPLNMVIKLSKSRPGAEEPWQDTIKLSDDRGKRTGTPEELENCLRVLQMES